VKRKLTQAAGILAVCIILSLIGCTKNGSKPLLWYSDLSFPFEMTLSTPNNLFTLSGERSPSSVSAVVISPENLGGLTILYKDGNCTISAAECEIPLSAEAAKGITVLFDGLLLNSADTAKIGSSEDGRTTISQNNIVLTLDENGLPASILHTESGREAGITVSPEEIKDTKNKDQNNNEHQTENQSGNLGIRADP